MGSRSRDTFKKRQKEVARAEKQQEKAARRLQRKTTEKRPLDDLIGDIEEFAPKELSPEEMLALNLIPDESQPGTIPG
ncbi:MAG: hypothetical protein ABI165_12905 [Bryobacteraceae bacterium]